jgi:periplasmic protein TonB
LFLISLSQIAIGQTVTEQESAYKKDETIYSSAGLDKQPEFPGGFSEFGKYVSKNYKLYNAKGLHGRVFVEFVISVDGVVKDIKVLRDIGYGTGEAAIKLMENCPHWIPGVHNGKPVNVRYNLPIMIDIK